MAGFEVSTYGRFWVSTEGQTQETKMTKAEQQTIFRWVAEDGGVNWVRPTLRLWQRVQCRRPA